MAFFIIHKWYSFIALDIYRNYIYLHHYTTHKLFPYEIRNLEKSEEQKVLL